MCSYAILGLAASLNPKASGGVERVAGIIEAGSELQACEDAQVSTGESARAVPKGFGRIVRDEQGNVVDIEMDDDEEAEEEEDKDEENGAAVLNADAASWLDIGNNGRRPDAREDIVRGEHDARTCFRFLRYAC
jgi:nucleolar protein 16